MKLKEALEIVQGKVKIGTQKGSGFVYIGDPKNALEILEISKFKKHNGGVRKNQKNKRPETYGPWPERKVLDSYEASPVIETARILIVEGDESSNKWFDGDEPEKMGRPTKDADKDDRKEGKLSYRNPEGYPDPTAYLAVCNVMVKNLKGAFA